MMETVEKERLAMVACKKCSALNGLDGSFCRKCGEALPETEMSLAGEKLEEFVAEGYRLLADGNGAEAMMVANSALATHPDHVRALSLKGMSHERAGELGQALECFEQVLLLSPDSSLDRIKVSSLRKRLAASVVAEEPVPDRRVALAGAFAAVLLVMAGAAYFSVLNAPSAEARTASLNGTQVEPLKVATQNPTAAGREAQTDPSAAAGTQAPSDPSAANPVLQRPTEGGTLPAAREGAASIDLGQTPVRPPIIGNIGIQPERPTEAPVRQLPPVDMSGQDPDPVEATAQEPVRENNGIVDIRISSGPARPVGGSEPSGNSLEALIQTGRTQYQLGRYADAARTYEKALKAGGDAGTLNQRLGQCYEKLGQTAQAIAAYQRAVNAYEAISGTEAGASRVRSALEASRQALKVLQSGG